MSFKKIGYIVTIAMGVAFLLGVFEGCSRDENSKLTMPTGDDVIIVDSQHEKAMTSPCGSLDAPCSTLTDALTSAAKLEGTIPIIWVKSGTYHVNPATPLEITMPMRLQVESGQKAIIRSEGTVLSITSSGVTIEGFHIISSGVGEINTVVVDGGKVTFKKSIITNDGPAADPRGKGLSIQNGGHVFLENSRIETHGSLGVEVVEGKIGLQTSTIQSDSDAVVVYKDGRAAFENSTFEGNLFTTGGSISVDNCHIEDISIADGGYATLSENTIQGGVSVLWKHAYANLTRNTIHGRVSAIDAKATLAENTIHGNQKGEGVTAFNFAELTLSQNTIFGVKYALYAHPTSTIRLNQNQFDSATSGVSTIQCEHEVSVESDGKNFLKNPNLTISCDGLPSSPETNWF